METVYDKYIIIYIYILIYPETMKLFERSKYLNRAAIKTTPSIERFYNDDDALLSRCVIIYYYYYKSDPTVCRTIVTEATAV